MASSKPLPPARSLLPKPAVYPTQTPHDFQAVPNIPTERGLQSQRVVPAAMGVVPRLPLYNSPSLIPVPRTTLFNQRKRAAETRTENDKEKRKYQRTATFNICKHCHLPKTKNFGHSRYIGQFGVESFCPSVEGRRYASKEVWLEERRKENPRKNKDELN